MVFNEGFSRIRFELKNISYLRFLQHSEYQNIISPYSRIYLIKEGTGYLVTGSQTIKLEAGFLYLVPSFVECSYIFNKDLIHIYIHFRAILENGLSVYELLSFQNKIQATELSRLLFCRVLKLNPGLDLPHHDPHVYQTKPWMDKKPLYRSTSHKLETEAIIQQLLSGFITDRSGIDLNKHLKYNMHEILTYIQKNLHHDIKIEQLAQIACLSKDHFTRIFKSVMGIAPCECIIRNRIEKSQFLLLTTDLSINQIIEETNFKNAPYFSRMFKKYTSYTPTGFRKLRQLSI